MYISKLIKLNTGLRSALRMQWYVFRIHFQTNHGHDGGHASPLVMAEGMQARCSSVSLILSILSLLIKISISILLSILSTSTSIDSTVLITVWLAVLYCLGVRRATLRSSFWLTVYTLCEEED